MKLYSDSACLIGLTQSLLSCGHLILGCSDPVYILLASCRTCTQHWWLGVGRTHRGSRVPGEVTPPFGIQRPLAYYSVSFPLWFWHTNNAYEKSSCKNRSKKWYELIHVKIRMVLAYVKWLNVTLWCKVHYWCNWNLYCDTHSSVPEATFML